MDDKSLTAISLLEALSLLNKELGEMALSLDKDLDVTRVLNSLECRQYGAQKVLEGYVDVMHSSGRSIAWWLETHWDDGYWLIERSVWVNTDEGQDTLMEFPDRIVDTFDEFVTALTDSVRELINSRDEALEIFRKYWIK